LKTQSQKKTFVCIALLKRKVLFWQLAAATRSGSLLLHNWLEEVLAVGCCCTTTGSKQLWQLATAQRAHHLMLIVSVS